eukprot:7702560-Karenia_brevis.AAC.1
MKQLKGGMTPWAFSWKSCRLRTRDSIGASIWKPDLMDSVSLCLDGPFNSWWRELGETRQ